MRAAMIMLACGVVLAGCTQRSDEIRAVAVSPSEFSGMSCSELSQAYEIEHKRQQTLSLEHDDSIVADVRVMGASLGSVPDKVSVDREAALGYVKGKVNALDIAMRKKGCAMP